MRSRQPAVGSRNSSPSVQAHRGEATGLIAKWVVTVDAAGSTQPTYDAQPVRTTVLERGKGSEAQHTEPAPSQECHPSLYSRGNFSSALGVAARVAVLARTRLSVSIAHQRSTALARATHDAAIPSAHASQEPGKGCRYSCRASRLDRHQSPTSPGTAFRNSELANAWRWLPAPAAAIRSAQDRLGHADEYRNSYRASPLDRHRHRPARRSAILTEPKPAARTCCSCYLQRSRPTNARKRTLLFSYSLRVYPP